MREVVGRAEARGGGGGGGGRGGRGGGETWSFPSTLAPLELLSTAGGGGGGGGREREREGLLIMFASFLTTERSSLLAISF